MEAVSHYFGSGELKRIGGQASAFGLMVSLGCFFAAQCCYAQTAAQAAEQNGIQAQTRQTDQRAEEPGDQIPDRQPDQQTAQPASEQAEGPIDQRAMAADQIIDILKEAPEALVSVKALIAQRSGADPGTIDDETIYNGIREDAELRDLASKELSRRGYDTGQVKPGEEAGKLADFAATKKSAPQTPKARGAQVRPYEEPDQPQVERRESPYVGLPSLRELYSQFPAAEKKLRRFGSDTFDLSAGNANKLPMDLPVGPDYVLGTGDRLVINLWGGQSSRLERPIDRQGQIALPEAGTVTIAGLTIDQAQSAIQKALDTEFHKEHVEISLGRVRTVRVYVVGDVERPGAYDVSSLSTPLSALNAAGGPTNNGSIRILRHYRGKELVRELDLYDFLLRGVRSETDRLLPGDTLLVPPAGPQVSVSGMVRRPAIYELKEEQGLMAVLDLAGGVLTSASLKQIRVERIEAHQRRTMLSLQMPQDSGSAVPDFTAFRVQDGDSMAVAQILPYNEQAVYLDGHVLRPGKYPYREGMTINDLLLSYQDLMPEPADHAELIRLEPPDFRPKVTEFNLPEVMIGNDPIKLRPYDLVRVFSRYEIDPPRVSIEGEVLRPGRYPLSRDMTVTGLVSMAGGFKRGAFREEADLASYRVEDGKTVLLSHHTIAVEKALNGDQSADAALKPGDVVSIRQLAGWQDIGGSVSISGEVEHAGSYGIEPGELLSSVLRRAGGLRATAYPEGAILERVQVRTLGERARQEMIRRIETTPLDLKQGLLSGQDQAELRQTAQQQRDQVLTALRSHPASGRLVIRISQDIGKWEKTPADVELRAGDTLVIPKREDFVMVSGQVYNATAINYAPGRDAAWYLLQSGGPTRSGEKKAIFVVRANGAVVGSGGAWPGGKVLRTKMSPGDTIVVPEKTVGAQAWKNVLSAAQIMSSVAVTGAVAGIF